jgi:hypothetical protein
LRRQALKELHLDEEAVQREEIAGQAKLDSLAIWEGKSITKDTEKEKHADKVDSKKLAEQDKRQRLYMPRGAILRIDLNEEHWLSFGVGPKVPAIVYSSYAFLSKKPVQTVGRFSEASKLRLSGLLWPEARTRWEKSAYATREALGNGQVILFAGEPNFRSYTYGTTRMLINSLLLGPGFGTKQMVAW